VVRPGFKQYDDLPAYYGLAGAYIQASTTEQWGLVVNEAMAAGLPVIISNRCGCAPDLVEEGRNGYTFDPYDLDALAGLLRKIAADDCDRAAMGQASREIIARWTPQTFAENLGKAAEAALNAPRPQANLLDKALLGALMRR
jgi:glycosyltransferase involved in cell wall biosynthesis